MKKIIITILVGLFSCQTPVVNNDKDKNMTNTTKVKPKDNTKPEKAAKECIPYDLGEERLPPYLSPKMQEIQSYMQKSPNKKENPYLGKIEIIMNEGVLPSTEKKEIIINKENKLKIEELEKSPQPVRNGIRINNKESFYFDRSNLVIMFNNDCEFELFKSKTNILDLEGTLRLRNYFKYFNFEMDLSKEMIEIEKIEQLLHEYNKNFINDITKIEFSSTNSLKLFLLFIKLTTQENLLYKTLRIPIYIASDIPVPT